MRRGVLSQIAYSNLLAGFGVLALTLSAVINHFMIPVETGLIHSTVFSSLENYTLFGISIRSVLELSLLNQVLQYAILLASGLILQHVSSEFRLIRIRSYFPFVLMCILGSAVLPRFALDGAVFSCLLLLLAVLSLFNTLERGSGVKGVFSSFVWLAAASLFQPRFLYLIPAFWAVMGILQIFHFKSFLASITGVFTVLWLVAGSSFLLTDYTFVQVYLHEIIHFELVDFSRMSPAEIFYLAFLAVLVLSAVFSFWPKQHLDKLKTRNYINSVIVFWFALLVLWFLSADNIGYLFPLLSLSALLIAHLFSLEDNLYTRIMFVVLLILSVVHFVMI